MNAAVEIFLNGIFGVFVGLTALYVAIKINKFVARRKEAPKEG